MHGLVSLGMLKKPHLIHGIGEGADQESPHTPSTAESNAAFPSPAPATHREYSATHTRTIVCPQKGPHHNTPRAGDARGKQYHRRNRQRNSVLHREKGHAGPLVHNLPGNQPMGKMLSSRIPPEPTSCHMTILQK